MRYTPAPKITLEKGGMYKLCERVVYYSPILHEQFLIPAGFEFSPSIPRAFRTIVPETSDTIAASLIHDFLYREQVTTRKEADDEWKSVLVARGVSKHIIYRSYYALRVGGFVAWRNNQKDTR